jgi:predicted metal-binding protein
VTFFFCGTCSGKRSGFQSAFEEEKKSNGSRCLHYADTRTREAEGAIDAKEG